MADKDLSFIGKDASERSLACVLLPSMASVPALDSDCCLVHLLNEPFRRTRELF